MGKVSPIAFEQFLNAYEQKHTALHNKGMSQTGNKTSEEIGKEYRTGLDELNQESFDILPNRWRKLANKKSTPRRARKLDRMYKKGFLKFGTSYAKYLDKKYGDGDGKLTTDEFVKSELSTEQSANGSATQYPKYLDGSIMDTEETLPIKNLAAQIDLDGNGKIDAKEMTALLAMYDMDVENGGINGKLKYYDIIANNLSLVEDKTSQYGKAISEKLKSMYEFLFPTQK